MAAFSKQNNLILQVATYMFPPVRKDGRLTGTNDRFSPEDAAYYMAYADYLILGKERFLAQEGQLPEPLEAEGNCEGDGVRCRAGKCSFWITWQGKMTPCGMFPEKNAPNVFEMLFLNVWQAAKESICNIHLPAQCSVCNVKDICRACAAMVVTESGCFDKVPKYRCDMMRACKAQWKRVKEEML